MKNGPGDPRWGWKMLMQDLRHPEQEVIPNQIPQQPQSTGVPQQISNIVNYPPTSGVPTTMGRRYHFASMFAIIVMVVMLIVAGVLLWKFGVIQHLMQMMGC
jgi:hypothetical protein